MAAIASLSSFEYTSGGCTLRVTGQLSPLSQVAGQPVLMRSRFHLQIYPQDETELATDTGHRPDSTQQLTLDVTGRDDQLAVLTQAISTYVQNYLSRTGEPSGSGLEPVMAGLVLQPLGLTRHRVTLPPAFETSTSEVELSTLQLCDLSDVLEQAECALQVIPFESFAQLRSPRPRLPLWIGSVAAVGVAAILGSQWLTLQPNTVVSPDSQPTVESIPQDQEAITRDGTDLFTALESPDGETSNNQPAAAGGTSEETPQNPGPSQAPTSQPDLPAPGGSVAKAPSATQLSPGQQSPVTSQSPASSTSREPSGAAGRSSAADSEPSTAAPSQTMESAPASPPAPTSLDEEVDQSGIRSPAPASIESAAPSTASNASPEVQADSRSASSGATNLSQENWQTNLATNLQQTWNPPSGLTASLLYQLVIGSDGMVQSVVPLNNAARTYQNELTLPVPGNRIQGFSANQQTTIRIEFSPSGEVVVTLAPEQR